MIYVRLTSEAVASAAHMAATQVLDIRGVDPSVARERAQRAADLMARPSIAIRILDSAGHRLAEGELSPAAEPATEGGLFVGLAAALGLHAKHVPLPGGMGTVVIAPDETRMEERVRAYGVAMVPVGALAIALAMILGRTVAAGVVRPMVDITRSLTALGAGDFTPQPIAGSSTTEVRLLAQAYDRAVRHVGAAFTERAQTEQQIRQFIADAGHELRTPLTIVMGYVDLLEGGVVTDPEARARVYENMRAEGRRMRRLVDRLILLARLERAQPEERPAALDIATLVTQIAGIHSALPEADRLHVELPPLPVATLLAYADPAELREAIENLLDNALKYAPQSEVFLRVGADPASVAIVVEDYGPGIDIHEHGRIFDRFYRGSANDGEVEGSGLGLAIVKRAVERAHGTIELESTVGLGSRFTIRLGRVSRPTA